MKVSAANKHIYICILPEDRFEGSTSSTARSSQPHVVRSGIAFSRDRLFFKSSYLKAHFVVTGQPKRSIWGF